MSTSRNWMELGWAASFFVAALLTLHIGHIEIKEFDRFARSALVANAEVTFASPGFQTRDEAEPPVIEYRFEVGGVSYSGSAEEYLPIGAEIEIWYSPENPEKSRLIGDQPKIAIYVVGSLFLAFVGVVLFAMGFNEGSYRFLGQIGLLDRSKMGRFESAPFGRTIVIPLCVGATVFIFSSLPSVLEYQWIVSAVVWVLLCFSMYWRVWAAAVFLLLPIVAFNPFLPFTWQQIAGWPTGVSGLGLIALAIILKPKERSLIAESD